MSSSATETLPAQCTTAECLGRFSSDISDHFSSFFHGGHPAGWTIARDVNPFLLQDANGRTARDLLIDTLHALFACSDVGTAPNLAVQLRTTTLNACTRYWLNRDSSSLDTDIRDCIEEELVARIASQRTRVTSVDTHDSHSALRAAVDS